MSLCPSEVHIYGVQLGRATTASPGRNFHQADLPSTPCRRLLRLPRLVTRRRRLLLLAVHVCRRSLSGDELPLDHVNSALGRGHATGSVAPIDVDFVVDDGEIEFGYCEKTSKVMTHGVGRLKKLVKLSQGRIESLCLSPFLAMEEGRPNDDQLLAFISENCPNLKHLSLRGSLNASEEAMKKLFQSCNKLELLDFSYAPCFTVPVLRELGSCCHGIRGIRRGGSIKYVEANAIASYLPNLRLLNLAETFLDFDGLSAIACGCNGLEFFDVTGSLACDLHAMEGAPCPFQDLPMMDHEECVFGEDANICC